MLRGVFLLAEGLPECCNTSNDADGHETEGDNGPDNTPAARRAAIAFGKDAGI